jgi:membrane-associated phospholipid phosphatase
VALPAFSVDYEITEELARNDGKKSIGAVKPTLYPSLAATSRFAGMVLLDVFGGQNYSPAGYAKLFRFHQALYSTKVVTFLAKRNIQRRRPDGSDTYSFFSGHASSVFATSTFLYLEVNDFIDAQARRHNEQLPLFSPRAWKMLSFGVLYGWAGYVGYSRIHDKKHYLSDVVAGAFCGSMISYLFYPHEGKSGNDRKIYLGIQPVNSGASIGVGCNF